MKSLLLFLLVAAPSTAFSQEIFGEVKFLHGTAMVGDKMLETGMKLHVGDSVKTDPKSFARILLLDGVALQVGPATTITLEKKKNLTRIEIASGALLTRLRKLKPSKKFEVKNGSTAMGVRGTTFYAEAKAKQTFLCVCEGEVESIWPSGKKHISAKHHDHPQLISEQSAETSPAPMGSGHTDADIAELEKLLPPQP